MAKVDLLLTEKEFRNLSSYASKAHGGLAKCGVEYIGECITKISKNTYFKFKKCSLDLGDVAEGELYLKDGGVHRSIAYPANREHLQGRSKFLLHNNGCFEAFDSDSLSRSQRLFMDKMHTLFTSRKLASDSQIMVSTKSFLIECDALLRRHYFVNKELDSLNSTSDAVFNFCTKGASKGYKHEHWINYLNSNECARDRLENISKRLACVFEKNPTLHVTDSEVLGRKYLTKEDASRVSAIIESSLIKSSISIRDDFINESLGVKCGTPITVNGVLFGVSQLPNLKTTEYEIRVKSDSGSFLKLVSNSEYFGGLISKSDLINLIENEIPVEITGEVISSNIGLSIAGKIMVPASTNIKASAINYDKSLYEPKGVMIKPSAA
ncbi:hypothetical protein QX249_09490 [Vibrio parahaemolyticus]|uniref:Uncharacterized protein n=1 Tax=Vibrio parahaemolyticus TaxID=670 RepID=A0AAW8Q333_VIBPH|nr:hypothetical protein [Vibrio parahaemolyticus]EGR2229491.1 hypothetical protein [Vibrio parahaemolyticus]MDS1820888.1 hypothetical protein [Vibrio parahaemolyticus]